MVRADGWLERGRSIMECVWVGWAGGSGEVLSCWELFVGEDSNLVRTGAESLMLKELGVGSIIGEGVEADREKGDAADDELDRRCKGECGIDGETDGSGVASCRG